jgi:1-acyl-sn-glycerol-3-phosphate acyltransferase
MIRSLLILIIIPVYTLLAGLVAIPIAALTGSPSLLYRLGRLGVRLGLSIAGVKLVVHDQDKLPSGQHFIYMMNHASNLDVPAVFLVIKGQVRALGKKELFRLPVLATAMRMGGFLPIDRSNRERAIESMRQAAGIAREGASFLLAPEGTRSRNGRLLPFKKGGFYLAIDSGVPIVPITVRGAYQLMPPGSFSIRPGTIEILFHSPVATSHLTHKDRRRLVETVRAQIGSCLEEDSLEAVSR